MVGEDYWLFLKSGIFSYSSKMALLVFGFLYTLIIANLLGPEEYGLAMFVLAFIGNTVFLFGVDALADLLVVFTPKYKSKKLFLKILGIVYAVFFCIFLVFFFFNSQIASFFNKGSASLYWQASFLFLFMPTTLLLEAFFKGMKRFGKVLKALILESFTNLFFAVVFVLFLKQGISGLILAKILSVSASAAFYAFQISRSKFEEKEVKQGEAKKYFKNIIVSSFLKKMNYQAMLLYMGMFISSSLLGIYYIAEKIVLYAMQMPIETLSDTLLPFASEKAGDRNALNRLVSLNIKLSLLFGVLFGACILLFGRIFLQLFFPQYLEAYWLMPFFVAVFLEANVQLLGDAYKSINRADVLVKSFMLVFSFTLVGGYFLISILSVTGLLLLRIFTNIIIWLYLYFGQGKAGLKIEVIPRKKDIIFFFRLGKEGFRKFSNRPARQENGRP
ncbi:MAG: oligosaccharide flippase family protein [Candidatus Diapherotrites archaeon]|nr:oligosaccharide flippase family protein [Candidatus Diapherotrites archaeon]